MTLSPSGRRLIVANQDSDEIVILAFDDITGAIGPIIGRQPTGTPMRTVVGRF